MLHVLGVIRVVPLAFLSRITLASPNKGRESPACSMLRLLSCAYSFHSGTYNRFRIGVWIYHVKCGMRALQVNYYYYYTCRFRRSTLHMPSIFRGPFTRP